MKIIHNAGLFLIKKLKEQRKAKNYFLRQVLKSKCMSFDIRMQEILFLFYGIKMNML
jgi:hypothetical protein